MVNYFYTEQIAEQIKKICDEELPVEIAKNISCGDFSILPEPESLNDYLPAIIINSKGVSTTETNKAASIFNMNYTFEVYYLFPYEFKEFEDTPRQAKVNAQKVANLFLNYPDLDEFEVEQTDNEQGGYVAESEIGIIEFESAETALFKMLDVPMSICKIPLTINFMTYQ